MQPITVIYRDERDRWVRGDHVVRRLVRGIVLPKPSHLSGMRMVVKNFLTGLEREGIPYRFNPPGWRIPRDDKVICFGLGALGLRGLRPGTRLIAAIGFPSPVDLPDLGKRFDLRLYLQHSKWVLDWTRGFKIYPDRVFDLWHAGIDTDAWSPAQDGSEKDIDVLVYSKIHWDRGRWDAELVEPVRRELNARGHTVHEVRYGQYTPAGYKALLARAKALLFLSPHESQGFACQEALSCGVPVLAWQPGYWMDPERFRYGTPDVPATSVPFFDARCGEMFKGGADFAEVFARFHDRLRCGAYRPREYVMENLTIANSTARMLDLYERA